MTQKPFEELTISDDFMFCKVMEHEPICKEFFEMLYSIEFLHEKLEVKACTIPIVCSVHL